MITHLSESADQNARRISIGWLFLSLAGIPKKS
jgi:hypothetical protein